MDPSSVSAEATPPRLQRLFERYPPLGEAWRDPLMEHYRETVLRQRGVDPRAVALTGMGAALLLATLLGILLPLTPGILTFVGMSAGPVWLALFGYSILYPPPGDRRFAFLTDMKHPDWRSFPFEPERAARLTALRVVLERQRRKPLAEGAVWAGVLAALQYLLLYTLGSCAVMVPFLGLLLLHRIWRVRDLHINESAEAYWIVEKIEAMAPDLRLPPLSQDPTATSEQKRLMYGDWSHVWRAQVPGVFGLGESALQILATSGPHIGGLVIGAILAGKLVVYGFLLIVMPPGRFAEFLRRRLMGGISTSGFQTILDLWASLLKRWQDIGMADPELRSNEAAQKMLPRSPAFTPRQKAEREEKRRRPGV